LVCFHVLHKVNVWASVKARKELCEFVHIHPRWRRCLEVFMPNSKSSMVGLQQLPVELQLLDLLCSIHQVRHQTVGNHNDPWVRTGEW
jgi:hypothetical protein